MPLQKTSNRSLALIIIVLVIALSVSSAWFIYRDTSVLPRWSSTFFSELSLTQSIQEIVATPGIANKETQDELPADKALRIASVSKVYTATVVLSLANQGLIDLDANITDYLDKSVTSGVINAKQATVQQLLLHTAGSPDYYDLRSYFLQGWTQPITLERTLPVAKRGTANFKAANGLSIQT